MSGETKLTFVDNWRITVQQRNAAWAQRVVVKGAATSNEPLEGNVGFNMDVLGNKKNPWELSIQHNDGVHGWQDNLIRLGAKTISGSTITQLVESEDGADRDYNDLVILLEKTGTNTRDKKKRGRDKEKRTDDKEKKRIGNCYGHCSGCYTDDVADAIANGATDRNSLNDMLTNYFEQRKGIGGSPLPLGRGDFIWWSERSHCALGTGKNYTVSQYGYPSGGLPIWGKYLDVSRRLGGKYPRTDAETEELNNAQAGWRSWFDAGNDLSINTISAEEIKNQANIGDYEVWRIKDEYRQEFFTCKILSK